LREERAAECSCCERGTPDDEECSLIPESDSLATHSRRHDCFSTWADRKQVWDSRQLFWSERTLRCFPRNLRSHGSRGHEYANNCYKGGLHKKYREASGAGFSVS